MARFAEADLLPISALQHLIFCERQCALIHNEQLWAENRLTVEGQQLHEKTHDVKRGESRPGIRIARGLRLRSFIFGITGQADVVEFHDHPLPDDHLPVDVVPLDGELPANPQRPARVLPVEYKRGRPKAHRADEVQLCAQALCLEEMLHPAEPIAEGRLFYGKTRRRTDVPFDDNLRQLTHTTITRLHQLIESGQTPKAFYEPVKCDRCSLIELCMPKPMLARRTASQKFDQLIATSLGEA